MKEKIGIEKLIELLNEYENSEVYKRELTDDDDYKDIEDIKLEYNEELGIIYRKELTNQLPEAILISKSFGFIKWLVENDKIDTSKANDKNLNGYEIELRIRAVKELVADSEEKTVLYLNLLMLLAIQDEPIRFLCEILK